MAAQHLSGEITAIRTQPSGLSARIIVPGTVHELSYSPETGAVRVRREHDGEVTETPLTLRRLPGGPRPAVTARTELTDVNRLRRHHGAGVRLGHRRARTRD